MLLRDTEEDGGNEKPEEDREKGTWEEKEVREKEGLQGLKEGRIFTQITQGTRDK